MNERASLIEITDLNEPLLDVFARRSENELRHFYEPEEGIFIAESAKVIERALDAGYEPLSMLLESRFVTGAGAHILARLGQIPVYTASAEVLRELTGFSMTGGMLCAMRRRMLPEAEQICENAERIAVLENVMNPTNVGAIMRSAAALNMDAVLLTPACSDPLYRRAIRVSMGTVFQIPWTYLTSGKERKAQVDLQGCADIREGCDIKRLQKMGFTTVAMALTDRAVSIDEPILRMHQKIAIVFGTEGDGLNEATISACDYTVRIPMAHGVDSLNVAAASAVAFWQLGQHA